MIDRTPRPRIVGGIPVPEREEVRHPGGLLGASTPLEAVRNAARAQGDAEVNRVLAGIARYAGAPSVGIVRLDHRLDLTYRIRVAGVPGFVDVEVPTSVQQRARTFGDLAPTLADAARRHRFAYDPVVEDNIERGSE